MLFFFCCCCCIGFREEGLQEHLALKHQLAELDSLCSGTIRDPAAFRAKAAEAMSTFLRHAEEEEREFLPKMAAAPGVSAQYLLDLGKQFAQARAHAPTRYIPARSLLLVKTKPSPHWRFIFRNNNEQAAYSIRQPTCCSLLS